MSGNIVIEPSTARPRAETVVAVTEIWERVLHRTTIRPDVGFFDLDATDTQADIIFAEIAKQFGRHLPTATICHAQTIVALSALLEQPTLPPFPPLVHLKSGSQYPPVIIAHGVGGRASFPQLARHIATGNPIYGLQAVGVDGRGEPLKTIEEMAQHYLGGLHEIQPQGPYMLIGYSFGGLIALEMARSLMASGERVALLALVDTYPHRRALRLGQRLFHDGKRISHYLTELQQLPTRAAFARVSTVLKRRLLNRRRQVPGVTVAAAKPRLTFAETTAYVKLADFAAMRNYYPRFYPGKVRFVRPATASYLPNNPAAVWKHLVQDFAVESSPGDHLGIVGKRFQELAAVLTRYVQEASEEG